MRNNAITLSHVCIVDRQNERFYSKLFFVADGLEQVYDSRTSDAVLLAIKHNVPIYVDDDILEQVKDKVQLQHTDNAPVEMFNDDELEGVMQRAIADENYERASLLRDEIQKRKRTASDSL